ncbi:hypothetical protein ABXN37_22040 [Piscinibacter sakaiensis]|uniref:Uncharacterized protein n=1 Tax=Piscinibacter sakaiensis TaxID=1547922 RepID=A0A0K8P5E3_PISS1|nr:hypothetical protein [Piscinibacter sakaiensis]GAP37806.1 hypothetical protein ISF6_3751 [Piscinibacter sakaiensis]
MPWYTEIRSVQDYSDFVSFLNSKKGLYGYDTTGGDRKSISALMGAWGCMYALEGKTPPNPHVMFTFNSLKDKGKELVTTQILVAEFVFGFCKGGPLANRGPEVMKLVRLVPTITDRNYEGYKQALTVAAKNGVNMQAVFREIIEMRPILNQLFEEPWKAFVLTRAGQFHLERRELGLLMESDIGKGLEKLRRKQKEKIDGSIFSKGHLDGQFLLLHEAKDGAPILLVSTDFGAAISEKHHKEGQTLMSTRCDKETKGYWRQTGNRKSIYFAPTTSSGGYSERIFQLALLKMDVKRSVMMRQPEELGIEL